MSGCVVRGQWGRAQRPPMVSDLIEALISLVSAMTICRLYLLLAHGEPVPVPAEAAATE